MKHLLTTSLALVALVALACDSQAFWGSRGSYGGYGSSGSYGSYGSSGSYGSYGSSGSYGSYSVSYGSSGSYGSHGGLFARHRARKIARRMARGSYGSYGSSGSYGSYGSSGSYGSYGSSGSYGGYSTPVSYESHSSDCGCSTCSNSAPVVHDEVYTKSSTGSGMLRVNVPADAVVYVNGKETTSTGTERQYISHGLESGRDYSYDVRVEYTVDGKTVSEERHVTLTSGSEELLAFAAPAQAEAVATTLNLHVPADAKVTLAGAATERSGIDRQYITTKLPAGQEWANYQVIVEHAGERQEKTITLIGGEEKSLDFHFSGSQVALRD
ncbi:TIGR03000 domain-containing protein [Aeoliella sp. ICT_H6.2]|uniref:TIGR03000 domain-containing protein n=1 Tax=Aeoliella straminimaris TaxID=2954799 RepID=A0A9X2FBR2_9BACT|nr:TIGR03000 domain-containing protein [Aeoliella straminimaris]MCO6045318.1 TIGR03000 domain-containing protein [Aeoliella straminimaris]